MIEKVFKSGFYEKIMIKSNESCVGINCESKPKFLYDMKNIGVRPLIYDYDIKNSFINVTCMKHENIDGKFINLDLCVKNSYFTLRQDFSNIIEILSKFDKLLETMSKSFEWWCLSVEIGCKLNYIRFTEFNSEKFIYVHLRRDFEDFNVLEKYDFIVTEKTSQDSDNKITYNGELLETDKYIVEFVNRPIFNKFTINLDDRINNLIFSTPYDYYKSEFTSRYDTEKNKYNIHFRPSGIESFLYLKLLKNVNWVDEGFNNYSETDVLAKTYNF